MSEMHQKKDDIFRVTLELVSEQGFHNSPMSAIAKRAGVGVGTIYRYFKNKEDLINALYIHVKTKMMKHILKNYSEDMSLRERFNHLIGETILYLIDHPQEMSFTVQYEKSPSITEETHQKISQIANPLINVFEETKEQNLLRDLSINVLGVLISGASISLATYFIEIGQLEEDSFSVSLDAIWDMVKK